MNQTGPRDGDGRPASVAVANPRGGGTEADTNPLQGMSHEFVPEFILGAVRDFRGGPRKTRSRDGALLYTQLSES